MSSGEVDPQSSDQRGSETHSIDINATNPGNPVFTSDKLLSQSLQQSSQALPGPREALSSSQHPMYVTTSNSYGSLQATADSTPNTFHGKSQKFSEHLGVSGMYRNHSLNTSSDTSRV